MGNWRNALLAVALVILLFELHHLSLLFVSDSGGPPGLPSSPLKGDADKDGACTADVTILGNFALTNDMPCTALFELTFGSLMTYLPELRPCPKVFVFEGVQQDGRKELDQKRYDAFCQNVEQLGISNLQMLQLPKHTTLIESVRYGLLHVKTNLTFLWQPDLMLLRRPVDWPKIVQKLLQDDSGALRTDSIRDVHFRYHHEWDTFLHGPRQYFNYSGFQEDVYIVEYCDQLQLATTSFYRDHLYPAIDHKLQKIPQKDWGWLGFFMEAHADVINSNHSSVGYGSCYKAHCDSDKRNLAMD